MKRGGLKGAPLRFSEIPLSRHLAMPNFANLALNYWVKLSWDSKFICTFVGSQPRQSVKRKKSPDIVKTNRHKMRIISGLIRIISGLVKNSRDIEGTQPEGAKRSPRKEGKEKNNTT